MSVILVKFQNDRPADSRERPKVFLTATFSCILAVSSGLPESPVTRDHSSIRFGDRLSAISGTPHCLGIFYRRKRAHLGAPKATTATARKLACLIYHLLKYKQPYQEPDPAIYQLRLQKSALAKLQSQAFALGYTLLPTAPVPA